TSSFAIAAGNKTLPFFAQSMRTRKIGDRIAIEGQPSIDLRANTGNRFLQFLSLPSRCFQSPTRETKDVLEHPQFQHRTSPSRDSRQLQMPHLGRNTNDTDETVTGRTVGSAPCTSARIKGADATLWILVADCSCGFAWAR